jgi:cytochrome c-type biogenesis protein CcmH
MRAAPILCGVLLALALAVGAAPAGAVNPDEILADPGLEARARDISSGLRCLVCQNQSIDDSEAPLARDLRILVRERLQAGDSDEAVVGFIVARYGEFVLLEPRLGPHTLLLWAAPAILIIIGVLVVFVSVRSRGTPRTAPLSKDEQRRLDAALEASER